MNNFVKIISLHGEERTLNTLRSYYSDYSKLAVLINDLTSEIINIQNVEGRKVLLKPNWVRHSLIPSDEDCLRTHDSFVLATLVSVLKQKPAKVTIGDAPIQGCDWGKMLSKEFLDEVIKLSMQFDIPVVIKDFRRVTFNPKSNSLTNEIKPLMDYIVFDLGQKSLLESITSTEKNLFRVNDYDPDRLAESHSPGVHKYCITKEMFDADIIISLPKIKTHQKSGITAALKNLVGFNGDKDYLPHHRIGGKDQGGDCYPGKSTLRYWAELTLDEANRHRGTKRYKILRKFTSLLWKISFPGTYHSLGAAWYGNDTTWRMVIDLNKIVNFGNVDGTLDTNPKRKLYSLCDGIIGGQGNGPLFPEPLPLGIVSFTDNAAYNDICMAALMGFDHHKIPLLQFAVRDLNLAKAELILNQTKINFNDLNVSSIHTKPSPGWMGHI